MNLFMKIAIGKSLICMATLCASAQDHGIENPATQDYNLTYQRFEFEIDPNSGIEITGKVSIYFIPNTSSFSVLNIDFNSKLDIDNIDYHGNSVNYDQTNRNLSIDLNSTVAIGLLDSVTISYDGKPKNGFYTGYHSGTPNLYSFSQSDPIDARFWFPCKQDLNDKIDSCDFYITTPKPFVAVANGTLESTINVSGNKRTFHFKHRYPIAAFLVAIAATNYEVYTESHRLPNGNSMTIKNYVFPESQTDAEDETIDLLPVFELFDELFGPYPFSNEQYGTVMINSGAYGIEHQTMSFVDEDQWELWLLTHELIHQWFGDATTAGDWSDIWLHEGMGHYGEGLIIEHELNTDGNNWDNWKRSEINTITSFTGGSVIVENGGDVFDFEMSYVKASMVMHMLRWHCGSDAVFYQGLRNYLSAHEYDYARTSDMQAIFEDITNLDLDNFFEDWIYGQGYPSYTVTATRIGSSNKLYIELEQSTSHSSVDFFEMHVPIYVSGEGQDTLLSLDNTFDGQAFTVTLPFRANEVEFDPDRWLISKNNVVNSVVTSTTNTASDLSYHIFPNPISNSSDLYFEGIPESINHISILDINGKVIHEQFSQSTILIEGYSLGMYFVKLESESEAVVQKITVSE